jgi:hypothetical protein
VYPYYSASASSPRGDVAEGADRARQDAEDAEETRRLAREASFAADEVAAWDARFEVRTMTRDALLEVARARGMRGYSKLRRGELLIAVERELYGGGGE